jgi:hypothetical protein
MEAKFIQRRSMIMKENEAYVEAKEAFAKLILGIIEAIEDGRVQATPDMLCVISDILAEH